MIQLLQDPQAIRFAKEDQINLNLLKQEINRRIVKIKDLVRRKTKKTTLAKSFTGQLDKQVQTQYYPPEVIPQEEAQEHVLRPSKKFHPNLQGGIEVNIKFKNRNRNNHEDSTNVRSKDDNSAKKGRYYNGHRYCHTTGHQQVLIESNGFTFRGKQPSERQFSTFRKHTLESQIDHQDNEDFLHQPHSDLYNSTIEGRFRDRQTLSPLQLVENPMSDVGRMSFFTDLSSSNRTKTEISQRKLANKSRPKIQQQDMIMPEPDSRIVVRSECLVRMQSMGESLVGRRRKQFWDNKLRLNLLRRIEERYGKQVYQC